MSEDEAGEEGDRLRIKFKLNGGGGECKQDQTHDNSSLKYVKFIQIMQHEY